MFKISLDDKPNLARLLKEHPDQAKEIISTFVELMEESVSHNWYTLPSKFSADLKFKMLVKGILYGSLNLKGINPDAYEVLGEEVHPLSMLSPRMNFLSGEKRYANWRNHYRLPKGSEITQQTIEQIFCKLLRYYKYVDIESLANALVANQVKAYEGLGSRALEHLPFIPALRYQQNKFGDLHVGKFYDDIGAFDCGETDDVECPACHTTDLKTVGTYKVCPNCNGGFHEAS